MTYDLIIVGGGPAGTSAAVYAARKQLRTLLILKEWGGQSTVSEDIQNWIGTPHKIKKLNQWLMLMRMKTMTGDRYLHSYKEERNKKQKYYPSGSTFVFSYFTITSLK